MTAYSLLLKELAQADKQERLNIFRRFFAASRYERLLIQQALVRSAQDISRVSRVKEMEQKHNNDFIEAVMVIKKEGFFEEFLFAAKDEDEALSKIIEAYDKRMNRS